MWSASDLDLIARAFPSHVVNILGRLEQRILQSGETKEEVIAEIRASYERALLDDEHIPPPPRDELQEQIDLIRWVIGAESPPTEQNLFPASLNEKLADWGDVEEDTELTTDDLLSINSDDAEKRVRKLPRAKRKKFTELLNVELAELQQERGGPGEDLKREGEIESLLGLFARVGEM